MRKMRKMAVSGGAEMMMTRSGPETLAVKLVALGPHAFA